MSESAIARTPVEIWSDIIQLATNWHPVSSNDAFPLKHFVFSQPEVDGLCYLYHEFRANERFRLRMRLVCQAWNTVINAMPLGGHYVLGSSTEYWSSGGRFSRAACLEIEHSHRIYSHCISGLQRVNCCSTNPHINRGKYTLETQDTLLLVDRLLEATMMALRCEVEPVHLQLLENAPLLQALSWIPPKNQHDPISYLKNPSHLTHLELRLGSNRGNDIIASPVTLVSLRVLVLKLSGWNPSISKLSTPLLSQIRVEGSIEDIKTRDMEEFVLQYRDTITTLLVDNIQVNHLTWHGTPTFWASFPKLSIFAVNLGWFLTYNAIPEGLGHISSSNRFSSLTIALPRMRRAHEICAQNITRWCSSHRSSLPIKRIAMMISWEVIIMDVMRPDSEKHFPRIRFLIEEFYKGGMTVCDDTGVDFYEGANEVFNALPY